MLTERIKRRRISGHNRGRGTENFWSFYVTRGLLEAYGETQLLDLGPQSCSFLRKRICRVLCFLPLFEGRRHVRLGLISFIPQCRELLFDVARGTSLSRSLSRLISLEYL